MTDAENETPPQGSRFRQNLIRVMSVQIIALALLWFLQHRYSR